MLLQIEDWEKHARADVLGIVCDGDGAASPKRWEECRYHTVALTEEEMLQVAIVRWVVRGAGHEDEDGSRQGGSHGAGLLP